jgi:hypothetical protein
MKFKMAEREPNYDRLKLVSEGGIWELGLWSVMFGVRVRMGRAGLFYVNLDYCAGADSLFQMELLNAIHIILLEVPESIRDHDLEGMFPPFEIKPINRDPHCWIEIQKMRDAARERLGIADEFYPLAA